MTFTVSQKNEFARYHFTLSSISTVLVLYYYASCPDV